MRVASLVLGIVSLLYSWVYLLGVFIFLPLAATGVVLGSIAYWRGKEAAAAKGKKADSLAAAGLGLSIFAMLAIIFFAIFWAWLFDFSSLAEKYSLRGY
ncbi:MAG: hypothetical protein F4Z29_13520 [Gemmatimonadetes bacterium]|nr:hypothetical protein [Gemmatimonadota bacterium]